MMISLRFSHHLFSVLRLLNLFFTFSLSSIFPGLAISPPCGLCLQRCLGTFPGCFLQRSWNPYPGCFLEKSMGPFPSCFSFSCRKLSLPISIYTIHKIPSSPIGRRLRWLRSWNTQLEQRSCCRLSQSCPKCLKSLLRDLRNRSVTLFEIDSVFLRRRSLNILVVDQLPRLFVVRAAAFCCYRSAPARSFCRGTLILRPSLRLGPLALCCYCRLTFLVRASDFVLGTASSISVATGFPALAGRPDSSRSTQSKLVMFHPSAPSPPCGLTGSLTTRSLRARLVP